MCHHGNFIVIRITFFIISTIIGAGFASGQELLQFFLVFRENGIGGLVLTSTLLGLLSWRLITLSHRRQLHTYYDLLELLPHSVERSFNIIIPAFLFLLLISLLSAFVSIAAEYCQLTATTGTILFIILIGTAALAGHSGLILVNLLIAPLLCGGIIMTGLHSSWYHAAPLFSFSLTPLTLIHSFNWAAASLLYFGYNFILLITAVIPFARSLPAAKSSIPQGCFIAALTFLLLSLLCFQTMSLHLPAIIAEELPLLSISCTQHFICFSCYLLLILAAIFSTALNTVLNCAARLSQSAQLNYSCCVVLTLTACLFFKELDLSTIIHYIFPVFGFAGLVLMILISILPLQK